jgi:thioredoxin 1
MTQQADKTTFDKQIKKPSVVYFYTSYCPVCRLQSRIFEDVSEQYESFAFYKVNLDEDASLAERYEITHVPTLMLFREGRPQSEHIGLLDAEKLAAFVENN